MKKEIKNREVVTSRIIIMFFAFSLLTVLSMLYIIPFKKHSLDINNYYVYFEYAVMLITFILAAISVFMGIRNKNIDFSSKIVTPFMLMLLTITAFAAAVVIPVSNNRTLSLNFAVISYFCLFIIYLVYHTVSKAMSYQATVCSVYCILIGLMARLYSSNVTFSDKAVLNYSTFSVGLGAIILLTILITYFVAKKKSGISLLYTAVFSIIAAIGIIVRFYITNYVGLITILVLIAAFIALIAFDKLYFSHHK